QSPPATGSWPHLVQSKVFSATSNHELWHYETARGSVAPCHEARSPRSTPSTDTRQRIPRRTRNQSFASFQPKLRSLSIAPLPPDRTDSRSIRTADEAFVWLQSLLECISVFDSIPFRSRRPLRLVQRFGNLFRVAGEWAFRVI